MRDGIPSASYSSVCNVLRQWNIPLIPTYGVYRLYDIYCCLRRGVSEVFGNLLCESYIIESVDSISRDERDVPLTQYITNA